MLGGLDADTPSTFLGKFGKDITGATTDFQHGITQACQGQDHSGPQLPPASAFRRISLQGTMLRKTLEKLSIRCCRDTEAFLLAALEDSVPQMPLQFELGSQ
jgi:hypothetical protein